MSNTPCQPKKIQPLIDGDILLHELGWSGEFKDGDTGEPILFDFEKVSEMLDEKIRIICEEVEATEKPIIFVTDSPSLNKTINRERKFKGLEPIEFVKGFRYDVAVTKPYKGTRKNPKPFHFHNILEYLRANYNVVVATGGIEADDLICNTQFHTLDIKDKIQTVICSRDKDLRICEGWHYSWECGKQGSIGPYETDRVGYIELKVKKDSKGKDVKSLFGYGQAFFYSQMLTGDSADNIPGLAGCGIVGAYEILKDCKTEMDYYRTVQKAYKDKLGDKAKEVFFEQANLLWMRVDNKPYETPKESNE